MTINTAADATPQRNEEIVRRVNGLYVGQLSDEELEAFYTGIREGFAARDYNHAGGFLGLAKVRFIS